MSVLRNQFLNTSSLLFSPPDDPPAGSKKPLATEVEDVTGQQDGAGAAEEGGEAAGGDDAGAADGEAAEGAETEEQSEADEDDDPDLADLPPETRAKAKAAIARRVAKEIGWRDRQIDRLHAKRRSAEEDVRAAGDIVGRQQPAAKPGENLTAEQIEERARVLASQMSAQERYDADANAADASGKLAYGDKWGLALAKLPKLGGVDVTDMVDILATDNPHVVLFSLTDPDTYDRVMALPPARRRNEFVKLSLKDAPKPRAVRGADDRRPSGATPPVVPLQGGRRVAAQAVNLYDDKVSDEAWYEERNRTRRKKFSDVS